MLAISACAANEPDVATPAVVGQEGTQNIAEEFAGESIVRIAVADTPVLDPAVGVTEAAAILYVNMYDTLVWPNHDGTISLWVAESYEVSPDGLIWDFTIQPGILFHNGDEMRASDVAFSMNRIITIGQGWGPIFDARVRYAEAIDDFVVRFHLHAPNGTFLSTLVRLYILSERQVMENAVDGPYGEFGDFGMAYLRNNAAGSGPYRLREFAQDQFVEIERFPYHWAGFHENNPDAGRFIVVGETITQRAMMARRELEITDPFMSIETYFAMAEEDGIRLAGLFKADLMSLSMNVTRPPLDCEHVRRALAWTMDYESIVTDIYPGSRRVTSNVTPSIPGVSLNAFTGFYLNLDRAREELALSRYAENIANYPIEVAWISITPDREKLALMLQANATQVGFNINVVSVPWPTIVETSMHPETTFQMITIRTVPPYIEAGAFFELSHLSREIGNFNTTTWAFSERLDAQIMEAIQTIDFDERMAKFVEMQDEFMATVPKIPLFEQFFYYAYQYTYLEWGVSERQRAGLPASAPISGYNMQLRDMRIFPERR